MKTRLKTKLSLCGKKEEKLATWQKIEDEKWQIQLVPLELKRFMVITSTAMHTERSAFQAVASNKRLDTGRDFGILKWDTILSNDLGS